jgi:hypothetical protein
VIPALASFFIPGSAAPAGPAHGCAIVMFVLAGVLWFFLLGWAVHLWSVTSTAALWSEELNPENHEVADRIPDDERPARRGFVKPDAHVERIVRESRRAGGPGPVNAMHITASVFINDDEDGLTSTTTLARELAPHAPTSHYRHNDTGEDQRRRPPQAPDHGTRGGGRDHRGKLDFGPGNGSSTASSTAGGRSACW